jgi:hypothetical protein
LSKISATMSSAMAFVASAKPMRAVSPMRRTYRIRAADVWGARAALW